MKHYPNASAKLAAVGALCLVGAAVAANPQRNVNALIVAPADPLNASVATTPTQPLTVIKQSTQGANSNVVANVTGGLIGWESSGYNYSSSPTVLLTPNADWVAGNSYPPGAPVLNDLRVTSTTISHPSGITSNAASPLSLTLASGTLSAGILGIWGIRRRKR